MKKLIIGLGAIVLAILVALPAGAAEFIVPPKSSNGSLSLPSGETHKNLYTAGGNLIIESTTKGDLYAAGGSVQILGPVEQDLTAAGGSLTITSAIGGDVRAAGGNLLINGAVGGDAVLAGGNVSLTGDSPIGGDAVIGAGNLTVQRPINGQVRIAGGDITINSKIGGNVMVRATKGLTFGPNARISGSITYQGPGPAVVQTGAQIPTIAFTKLPEQHKLAQLGGIFAGLGLLKILAMLLAALAVAWLMKRHIAHVVEGTTNEPWLNLGIGFLAVLAFPVAIGILFLIIVGYYAALLTLAWFGFALLATSLVTAMFAGSLLIKYLTKKQYAPTDWRVIILGLVVIALLGWIPIVGWLADLVLFLMTFGGMLRMVKQEIIS